MSSVTVEQDQPGPQALSSNGSHLRKQVLAVALPMPQTSLEEHESAATGLQTFAHQKTARPRDMRMLQRSSPGHGFSRQSPCESARH
jgi:hypothetical protein